MFEIDAVPPDDSVPDNVKVDTFLKEWSSLKREPCAVCSLPVFLAQRLRAGGRLYHRTCFRCQRCGSQLSPADSYETCSGAWVCETCPDEMPVPKEKLPDESPTEHREPPMEHPKPLEHQIELRGHPKPLEHPIEPPPDPPPSLVAARRLLFDTDDAKLLKQDHAVNTRLALSDHKDLSPITRTVGERKPVNITIDKESSSEQEDETSFKNRKHLVQNVNNTTIPVRAERAKDPVEEEIGPPAEKEDASMKLVTDISVNKPLDVRENTLNVKDNGNVPNVERLSLQSDEVDKPMNDKLPAKRNSLQSDEVDKPINEKLPFKRLSLGSYEIEKPFKRHSLQSYEVDKPIDDKLPLSDEVDKPTGDKLLVNRHSLQGNELDKSRTDVHVEKPSFQSEEVDIPMMDELPTETPSLQSEEANKSGDNELLKERLSPHNKVDELSNDELPIKRFSLPSEEVDKSRGEELSYYHTIPGMSESKQEIEESAELILEEAKNSAETVEAINTEVEIPVTSKEGSSSITPESSVGSPLKSIKEDSEEKKTKNPSDYPDDLNPFGESEEDEATEASRISTNPFGSDSEDDEPVAVRPPPRAAPRKTSLGVASTASTNPFGSDEDEEDEASASAPVPAQRQSMQSSPEPTPFPRRSKLRTSARSITSLSSIGSYSSTSPRKKRPAPPPPTSPPSALLTPSSRHPSVSSLASVRSRKTKRAPLPPNLNAAAGLPPRPKSPEKQQEAASSPSESQSIPKLEVSGPSVDETTTVETTKEVASQIEEGIKKMIVQHEDDSKDSSFQLPSKQEKDSVNERMSTSGVETVCISEITEVKTEDKPKQDEISLVVKENEINKSVSEEKYHSGVILNKQNLTSLDNVSCKKDFDSFEEIELKDTKNVVEAYNEDVLTHSRNSSVIHFDEVHSHSTPVKIVPSAALLNSSQEDVASGHSFSGTPYLSSPSASCADTSSYQESLASPPTEKRYKDTANMHRKISESGVYIPHKSVSGQWKRKKGPAPALPLPQRRNVKPMAMHRIRQELSDIEIKQQELERQGVALEQKIRLKFDSETSITPYIEELVLQLFELVNEKNELFRKQAELMYMRRQHQLEEEHAELEYQIRCLMARPELNKTDSDKELEEKLIQRLVEVVERRDAIVQCLEMDRIRETEEDRSINRQLDKFTQSIVAEDRIKIKKKHKKKKDKHNTLKMLDLDKDLDESEKDSKKKKKWYTLHHRGSKHM